MHVSFDGCEQLSNISAFGESIASLAALQHLEVSFARCRQLSDIAAFGGSIATLAALQHLQVYFAMCVQLSDIAAFGASIASLPALQHVVHDFCSCTGLLESLRCRFTDKSDFLEVAPSNINLKPHLWPFTSHNFDCRPWRMTFPMTLC